MSTEAVKDRKSLMQKLLGLCGPSCHNMNEADNSILPERLAPMYPFCLYQSTAHICVHRDKDEEIAVEYRLAEKTVGRAVKFTSHVPIIC
jgi:hypothetical protein